MAHLKLQELPDELLLETLNKQTPEELIALLPLNRQFNSLVKDNQLWLSKIKQHFPYLADQYSEVPNAYEVFWQIYEKEYKPLSTPQRRLFSLAKEGDSALLDKLTSENFIDLYERDAQGLTLRHWLAAKGGQTSFNALYENAEFRTFHEGFLTAASGPRDLNLQWAIYCHQPLKKIKQLIAQFPPQKQPFFSTYLGQALVEAVDGGHAEVVRYLCSLKEENKPSAELVQICLNKIYSQEEIVKILCSMTGDNKPNRENVTKALNTAAERGYWAVVTQLCSLTSENKPSAPAVWLALGEACRYGQLEVVKHLCSLVNENKPSVDAVWFALAVACDNGQWEVVKHLCSLTSENKPPSRAVESALRNACEQGQLEVVKYLYNSLAADNIPSQVVVEEALIKAADSDHIEVVEYLCSLPTDNKPSQSSINFILNNAARNGQLAIVKYLCEANASLEVGDALAEAARLGHLPVVKYLRNFATDDNMSNVIKFVRPLTEEGKKATIWLKNSKAPASYKSLCEKASKRWQAQSAENRKLSEPLAKARALLEDYTKGNSAISLFFHGHWNRHHVVAVATIIKEIDNGRINNENDLMTQLDKIRLVNETGSLARRKDYIRDVIFVDLVEKSPELAINRGNNP